MLLLSRGLCKPLRGAEDGLSLQTKTASYRNGPLLPSYLWWDLQLSVITIMPRGMQLLQVFPRPHLVACVSFLLSIIKT